jgi:hypothetical protein
MSEYRVCFTGKMTQNENAVPSETADFIVDPTPNGIYVQVGCNHGTMTCTAAERLAKEILAAVPNQKKLTVSEPFFSISFNDGTAEDMGPYSEVEYLDATDELQATYGTSAGSKAKTTRKYAASRIDKIFPHKG